MIPGIIRLEETASTNDDAKNLARQGAEEGTMVIARRQTAGRGRQGNQWVSDDGNLFMSVVLRPGEGSDTGQLSFVAAVALAETLESFVPSGADVLLKWPNDVLINKKKAAGILLESESFGAGKAAWVVVGMGVNVAHAPEGAVSLKDLGVACTADHISEKISERLMRIYRLWQGQGFAEVRSAWLQRAHALGQEIGIRLPQDSFRATFTGISASGALEVRLEDGTERRIASGEVFAL